MTTQEEREKTRARRHERKVKTSVRAAVATREEHRCRLWPVGQLQSEGILGFCWGLPEWAHLEEQQRFKTRGQSAERRHTTAGSLLFCFNHHTAYDAGLMTIAFLTDRGANGRMRFKRAGVVYEEPDAQT